MIPPCPLPPAPHPRIHLLNRNTISNQPHRDSQHFNIFIPTLIIKEQHILILDTSIPLYPPKMRRLVPRVYLQMRKVVYCARRTARCAGDLQELEHLAAEIWGVGSRCGADEDAFAFELGDVSAYSIHIISRVGSYCLQNSSNIIIEAVAFAISVLDFLPALYSLERACDVRVYPEWP
jgi:hypothetical protein